MKVKYYNELANLIQVTSSNLFKFNKSARLNLRLLQVAFKKNRSPILVTGQVLNEFKRQMHEPMRPFQRQYHTKTRLLEITMS